MLTIPWKKNVLIVLQMKIRIVSWPDQTCYYSALEFRGVWIRPDWPALMDLTNFSPLIFFGFLVQTHQGQEAWGTVGSPVKAQMTKPESLGLKVWADVSTSDLLSTFWSELLKSNVTSPPWFPSLWVSTFFPLTSTLWSTDLWQHRYHFCTLSLLAFFF